MKLKIKASCLRAFYARTLTTLILTLIVFVSYAQTDQGDGSSGITSATAKVKGYFDVGISLMYAIGALVGLVGAIKVFNKWNSGEPDTNRVASAWFGSCVFLVVVATILRSFFGL